MLNLNTDILNVVYIKPIIVNGETAVNVFSERGELLWQSRVRNVAEIIARAHGLEPVSLH